ncbi:ACSBG [Lepeophtheirus salmonis]|uniref:ACSBG n=1 Tax=Lepeophtheirus salmonis TaxID=72036 RepID=A0A7R8D0Q8_LEPSM|nr:ACSBG [Lepeophtheirus salmonis]CAF2943647.1 ACSBG [Lepeophtheirus salmonis]
MSVPSFVKHNCLKGGSQIAMAIKRNGDWMRWTYSQYYREIRLAAKAFIKLGLKPFHTEDLQLDFVVIEEDGFIADKLSILWRDLIELGKTEEEDQLKQRLHNIAANQCCSRKKELLITAGGENIAPILIEDNIKNFLPVLSNVVAIGDLKKFISVFLTFKVNSDTNGQPSTELSNSVKEWCHSLGYEASTVTNIIRDQPPEVMSAIQKGIDMANEIAVSNAARVKKWSLIPRELSMDNGEMGPTLK